MRNIYKVREWEHLVGKEKLYMLDILIKYILIKEVDFMGVILGRERFRRVKERC